MYGYNTAIVAGISKPALEGFFNATFYDPEKKTCVKIKDHPGVMVETSSESNMAAFEGLFVSDILVCMLLGAYVGPVLAKSWIFFGQKTARRRPKMAKRRPNGAERRPGASPSRPK